MKTLSRIFECKDFHFFLFHEIDTSYRRASVHSSKLCTLQNTARVCCLPGDYGDQQDVHERSRLFARSDTYSDDAVFLHCYILGKKAKDSLAKHLPVTLRCVSSRS